MEEYRFAIRKKVKKLSSFQVKLEQLSLPIQIHPSLSSQSYANQIYIINGINPSLAGFNSFIQVMKKFVIQLSRHSLGAKLKFCLRRGNYSSSLSALKVKKNELVDAGRNLIPLRARPTSTNPSTILYFS